MEIFMINSSSIHSEMFASLSRQSKYGYDTWKIHTFICYLLNEKYQPLAIDMTKDKIIGRYRLGLNSLFNPDTNLFYIR